MKTIRILALMMSAYLILFTTSCKDDTVVDDPPDNSTIDTIIHLSTDFGDMYMYMFKGTPLHRHNFHKLVGEGFYDGTEFHRIIPNFMIQGGDPLSKDGDRSNDGTGGPGYKIPAEIDISKYTHVEGSVAAARTNNPQKASSGSQFYIVVDEPGTAKLNNAYTIFGQVIKGFNTAQTIVVQPRNGKDLPDARIKMTMKILVKTHNQIKSEFGFDAE